MFGYICPVCGKALAPEEKAMRCANGHSYDVARSGYVNLLMSNAPGARRHGDDALMIKARRDFLELGHYRPLLDGICAMLTAHVGQDAHILDAGCGDGWYTAQIAERLADAGISAELLGVDISRDALKAAARRCGDIGLAVASVFRLPLEGASCGAVVSIFAPLADEEFGRVLKDDGLLLRVVPLEDHLWELKQAVYDVPRKNPPDAEKPQGFELADSAEIRYSFTLHSNKEILDLFAMTPYYYKSGKDDQRKLETLNELEITAGFGIRLWKKK